MSRNRLIWGLAFLLLSCQSNPAEQWLVSITSKESPALSFRYGNMPSSEWFKNAEYVLTRHVDARGWNVQKAIFTDPKTLLSCTIEGMKAPDMDVVEWTCFIENKGKDTTQIFTDILSCNRPVKFEGKDQDPYHFFYSQGSHDGFDDFSLCDSTVAAHDSIQFITTVGFSSTQYLPFFTISKNDQSGIITSIGWSGQWKALFQADNNTLQIQTGMENTHLVLYPGEKIRTPMGMMLFWEGKRQDAQNALRRYIVAYSSPKPSGKELRIPISFTSWGGTPTSRHLEHIQMIREKDLGYDNYWIDAGWFGGPHPTATFQDHATEDWYGRVGNWEVNTLQHSNGLRPISDAAHEAGLTFLLWFEPERAIGGTPVAEAHPEWFMTLPDSYIRRDVGQWKKVEALLLNLGIPQAREWITQFISHHIQEMNMDILRIDSNTGPLKYWQNTDTPDRIGITEIKYVEGFYQFLDDLLETYPHLLIDNCAGGGHRLDLEMLRRSVALHRSDYVCYSTAKAIGCQQQAFSIMNWIPYSNTGTTVKPYDAYRFRSNMNAGLNFCFLPRTENGEYLPAPEDYPWDWFRQMMLQHASIKDCYSGDYFPLTPFSLELDTWCAYQLYRKDKEKGFLLAFRREEAKDNQLTVHLGDVAKRATYLFHNLDTDEKFVKSGQELLKNGLTLSLDQPRSSTLIVMTKQ